MSIFNKRNKTKETTVNFVLGDQFNVKTEYGDEIITPQEQDISGQEIPDKKWNPVIIAAIITAIGVIIAALIHEIFPLFTDTQSPSEYTMQVNTTAITESSSTIVSVSTETIITDNTEVDTSIVPQTEITTEAVLFYYHVATATKELGIANNWEPYLHWNNTNVENYVVGTKKVEHKEKTPNTISGYYSSSPGSEWVLDDPTWYFDKGNPIKTSAVEITPSENIQIVSTKDQYLYETYIIQHNDSGESLNGIWVRGEWLDAPLQGFDTSTTRLCDKRTVEWRYMEGVRKYCKTEYVTNTYYTEEDIYEKKYWWNVESTTPLIPSDELLEVIPYEP